MTQMHLNNPTVFENVTNDLNTLYCQFTTYLNKYIKFSHYGFQFAIVAPKPKRHAFLITFLQRCQAMFMKYDLDRAIKSSLFG